MSELYKQILQTPEAFRRPRNSPEALPVKTQVPNTSDDMISEVAETDTSQYEVSDSELLYSEAMAPKEVKGRNPGQTEFSDAVSIIQQYCLNLSVRPTTRSAVWRISGKFEVSLNFISGRFR